MINYYGKWELNDQEELMTSATAVRHKRGGVYFEDFVPGEVIEHRYTRTVTQTRRSQRYTGSRVGLELRQAAGQQVVRDVTGPWLA